MQYEYSATQDFWLQEAMFAKDKKNYLPQWRKHYETSDRSLVDQFDFIPNSSDALNNLPALSFILRVPFKLKKPYLSKDDRSFHLLDNPVRKDKVFKTPMVSSTSWKGALRAALWQLGHKEENEQIIRLFGNEREQEDHKKLKSGRLYFYPTFFDKIDKQKQLEVINPHDRKKGTSARGPIYLECVPKNSTGELVILYVPFGTVEKSQVIEDLELVVQGVKEMLTVYGFGAKTSSGFGIVEDQLDSQGELAIRGDIPELKKKLEFLNDDGTLKQEFVNNDGSFRTESQYKKSLQKQNISHNPKLYKEAKQWYEENKQKIGSSSDFMTEVRFNKLSELGDRAKEIAVHLCNGVQV
ncbi:MAG: hypothetical protein RLZZ507_4133 [Cyanobacteriota bacterium]|jgi:CRISPR-associated protein Cmr2